MNMIREGSKVYLMSGHTSTGGLKSLTRRALDDRPEKYKDKNDRTKKDVLVLNLSQAEEAAQAVREEFFRGYFRELGVGDPSFICPGTAEDRIDELFSEAGLVYLPDGETGALIDNVRGMDLVDRLGGFKGVVVGNGAGAHALCRSYPKVGHGEPPQMISGLGLVNICVVANYKPKFDEDLLALSREQAIWQPTYALGKGAAVVLTPGGISFPGDVWSFNNGHKRLIG